MFTTQLRPGTMVVTTLHSKCHFMSTTSCIVLTVFDNHNTDLNKKSYNYVNNINFKNKKDSNATSDQQQITIEHQHRTYHNQHKTKNHQHITLKDQQHLRKLLMEHQRPMKLSRNWSSSKEFFRIFLLSSFLFISTLFHFDVTFLPNYFQVVFVSLLILSQVLSNLILFFFCYLSLLTAYFNSSVNTSFLCTASVSQTHHPTSNLHPLPTTLQTVTHKKLQKSSRLNQISLTRPTPSLLSSNEQLRRKKIKAYFNKSLTFSKKILVIERIEALKCSYPLVVLFVQVHALKTRPMFIASSQQLTSPKLHTPQKPLTQQKILSSLSNTPTQASEAPNVSSPHRPTVVHLPHRCRRLYRKTRLSKLIIW